MEKPPPDDIDGWRIHSWVLVLPGTMGISEPFFIEPSEGFSYPLSAARYQRLDCVYNHENYYVRITEWFITYIHHHVYLSAPKIKLVSEFPVEFSLLTTEFLGL